MSHKVVTEGKKNLIGIVGKLGLGAMKHSETLLGITRRRGQHTKAIRSAQSVAWWLHRVQRAITANDLNAAVDAAYGLGRAQMALEVQEKRVKGGAKRAVVHRQAGNELVDHINDLCKNGLPKQKAFNQIARKRGRSADTVRNQYYKRSKTTTRK
jgi:hypothetical protein